jgi:hypothetical protein
VSEAAPQATDLSGHSLLVVAGRQLQRPPALAVHGEVGLDLD